MVQLREPKCWHWMLTTVAVLTTMTTMMTMTMVTETGAQKVEKDGMDSDKYNMVEPEATDRQQETKKGFKYMVTEEVYFDIMINNSKKEEPYKGRITIACFGDITPITCLNFVALAKGHQSGRRKLQYKNTPIHRVVRDFVIQMGDVTGGKGKSGTSIYGESFQDENFKLSHRGAGWVSMANHGRNTNGSQFFILLQPARWLDGKHVVFGKVIKGMDVIRKLGDHPTTVSNRPKGTVMIVNSGIVGIPSKYELTEKEITSAEDIK